MRPSNKVQVGTKELRRVDGNHERRLYSKIGLNFDEILCRAFAARYPGRSALRNVVVKPYSYDFCRHYDSHGRSSGKSNVMRVRCRWRLHGESETES